MTECVFCRVGGGADNNLTYGVVPESTLESLIIGATQHFNVVLDLAPLVADHCLIVSKEHVPSFAHLDGALWNKFSELRDRVSTTLSHRYGFQPTLFEHGAIADRSGSSCRNNGCSHLQALCGRRSCNKAVGSGCINHAHLHVVPVCTNLSTRITADGHPVISAGDNWSNDRELPNQSYLYYRALSNTGVFYGGQSVPSQYLRQLIGEQIGEETWVWQEYLANTEHSTIAAKLAQSVDQLSSLIA